MPKKTKTEIIFNINNDIVSNNVKRVTPEDIRKNLIDIVDSISTLSTNEYIVSLNFSTPITRNTRGGIESLDKVDIVPGYVNSDNTAFGFHSLYANYNANGNSAFGSYALGCNIYGEENTAYGWHALSVNQDGDNNVAVGTHALKTNKYGNNNIAIGPYAGYYIGNNDSFKFFVSSHNLSPQATCDNPEGSGITPFLYGDLLNNILVVGHREIHNQGKLQVNGSVTPSKRINDFPEPGNLGSVNYPWNKVYARELNSDSPYLSVNNNFVPKENGVYTLGDSTHRWSNGYINNLFVNGSMSVNDLSYNQITESQYLNKTLYLASSGTNALNSAPAPYLTDEGIDGGGVTIQSSGSMYRRNYSISYRAPNLTWDYANTAYAKSSWESNISFVIDPDCFFKTDRVIGRNKLLLSQDTPTRNGVTIANQIAIGKETLRDEYYNWDNGGDYNHIVGTGVPIYSQNMFAKGSGISLQNNELSRYDGTLDTIYGFSSTYDDKNGKIKKRFIGYNGNPSGNCSFVIDALSGRAGFSNKNIDFDPITTFNMYGSGTSIFRNSSLSKASIQLSVNGNGLVKGLDISHSEVDNKTRVGILKSAALGEIFNFGESGFNHNTSVSILENSGVVTSQENYGTIIVRPNSSPTRSQSIFLQDDQGREFDLLSDAGDIFNDDFVYHDNKRNTLLGDFHTDTKDKIYASGGYENTAIGHEALDGLVTGSGNTTVGYRSGYGIKSGNNNILIGHILGSEDLSNALLVGNRSDVIVYGEIPTSSGVGFFGVNEHLEITKTDSSATNKLEFVQTDTHSIIKKVSKGRNLQQAFVDDLGGFMGSKPTSSLFFDFEGTTSHRLLELNASGSLSSTFVFTNTRPYATLKGDLNLYGDLRFPDGTAITSASGLQITAGTGIAIVSVSGFKEISFSISNIPTYGGPVGSVNSNLVVETSGVVQRCPVSQLMQYVNHTNPQTYFNCPGGYNLVLSNNSAIYHDKNCNSIFGGNEAGDDAEGFTNSVILGTQAGQQAYFNNTSNLTVDTASVFIGYNSGRKSRNADNSIFIGPSAGQHSINTDNSIFIGNSAGESSKSSKSISIGDNTLEGVEGENNLEIVANREDFNRIIGGAVNHKMSVGGVVAGDTCVGRVSIGGAARVFPTASVESSSKFGDGTVPVHKWFNSVGDLVAYLDQNGNMILKGVVTTSSYMNESNLVPGIMPTELPCGNQNISGNTPVVILPNVDEDVVDNDEEIVAPSGFMLGYTPIYNEI